MEISKTYGKTEWREDLKRILQKAGGAMHPTVFLFSDTQIKDEAFVEDINNLLNSGEVPNMFPSDEKMQVSSGVVFVMSLDLDLTQPYSYQDKYDHCRRFWSSFALLLQSEVLRAPSSCGGSSCPCASRTCMWS